MVKKYITKPTEIEAVQWTGDNYQEIMDFCGEDAAILSWTPSTNRKDLRIRTLEGIMDASPSDYIIKGVLGEFYPCKESAFIKKYKEID